MPSMIQLRHVVKIFGDEPRGEALNMLKAGYSKDEIQEHTGHVVGVDDADFDVEAGEIFVVMGLSGSGKSTLIRCVNRLVEPTAGEVIVDGIDVTALEPRQLQEFRRNKTGMVFQHFGLFPHQSVLSNVAFGLKVKGVPIDERRRTAEETLSLVGLSGYENSFPSQLSGGMQQRVGLARALASNPDILLMDEAFSALDPLIRRQMQDELLSIQAGLKERNTILFITHDLNEALRVGTRVCIMKDGAIHQIGTPEDILLRPGTDYVAEFVQDVDQGRVLLIASVSEPATAVESSASVAAALDAMARSGSKVVHVVDSGARPIGIVTQHEARAAQTQGTQDLDSLIQQTPNVTNDMILAKVYQLCEKGLPLSVVDTNGALVGSVRPLEILAELGRVESISERLELAKSQAATEGDN
ncbi:MAG: glycine betaine/L-proline ABC transporter ATP-binding protein [Acidimicrobiia bacterium]|nr:glycine betaine/L-proline ABC transporter ATP-binding protein [Acidimicrobiia bacterium]MCY4457330.1 glycine betaine/L-proline ABC transporter ATP-binding protein [Acidimicrobiaceae bacterium]